MDGSGIQTGRGRGFHCECSGHIEQGWYLESYWSEDEAVCVWHPKAFLRVGPPDALDDQIAADLIVCHCLATAVAAAHLAEGLHVDAAEQLRYATSSLEMTYRSPVPLHSPLTLRARIRALDHDKTILTCSLFTGTEEHARGEVVAVRVPTP